MLENLRIAISLIEKPRRKRWAAVVLLAVAGAVAELVAAFLVLALLGAVTGSPVEIPLVRTWFSSLDTGSGSAVVTLALVTAGFYVLRSGLRLLSLYAEARIIENEGVLISRRLMRGYLALPYISHVGRNTSDFIKNAFWSVQEMITRYMKPAVQVISESMVTIAILTVLAIAAPLVTALALAGLAVGAFALMRIVQPRLKRMGEEGEEFTQASLMSLQESLRGIREIKVLQREETFTKRYTSARAGLAHTRYVSSFLSEIPRYVLESLLVGGIVVVVLLAEQSNSTTSSLAVLGLFGYAAFRILPAANRIVAALNKMRYGDAPLRVISDDLDLIREQALPTRLPESPRTNSGFSEKIDLRNVRFRYPGSDTNALTDVNLTIAKGESLGIVGPTGGGKSTFVDILLGLIDPTEGSITVDGVPLNKMHPQWLSQVGLVSQDVFVLDDTVRGNIAVGVSPESGTDDRLWEALSIAQLESFVRGQPLGLETPVGESGVRLSGGQRQRLAIARAVYKRPSVVVLDEGTAALDGITEADLMRAIQGLRSDRTLVMVAHRLATVRGCDRIVLIDQGRIAEVGTYEELLARSPMFAQMAG